MVNPVTSPVEIGINASAQKAFAIIVPAELSEVLLPKAPLPGVRTVEDKQGDWNKIGDSRQIIMTDGSSVRETLTTYNEHTGLSYRIDGFDGPLKFLVTHMEGEWTFRESGDNQSHVSWVFTFYPRSIFTAPIVSLIARHLWPGYAGSALTRLKNIIEQETRS